MTEYAFTVIGFKIVAVYKIFSWHNALETEYHIRRDLDLLNQDDIRNRYEFLGKVDKKMQLKYLDRDVKKYFKSGNANPVKYINC